MPLQMEQHCDDLFQLLNKREIIGYDFCKIYDAVELYRCYNGNDEFHLTASKCPKKICFPICSEEHEIKDIKSGTKRCSYCVT